MSDAVMIEREALALLRAAGDEAYSRGGHCEEALYKAVESASVALRADQVSFNAILSRLTTQSEGLEVTFLIRYPKMLGVAPKLMDWYSSPMLRRVFLCVGHGRDFMLEGRLDAKS